jgi:FKBP-type peptidyl-prolyl cis-trans isomerase
MKLSIKSFVGIFALGLCVSLAAEKTATSSAPGPAKPDSPTSQTLSSGFNNQQIIETWGWIIAQEKRVAEIEISEAELSAFLKGVAAGFKGQPVSYDLDKIFPDVERMAKARREKVVRTITEKNEAEAKVFFTGLDKNTNVVKLPGGVRYEIIRPGSGPYPKTEQTVNVHYVVRLIDGTEFLEWGPIDIVLVINKSLPFASFPFPSWFEDLRKINKGGTIKFYVPPPLPEADVARAGIPPGSTMIFEVELLDLKDTTPENLEISLLPPAPEVEPPPPSGYSEQQIIETWGWNIARETRVSNLGFSEAELSLLTKGLVAGVKGQPPPYDLEKIHPAVEQFVNDRREQARLAFKQKQLAASEVFFTGLKKNTNVVELPSGLRYEIIKPGSGPYPKVGKTVKITYVGRLLNGKVFDTDEEINVEISNNPPQWIIPGWTEGLQKINKGGKIKLYIPHSLAYGDRSIHNVPPYSTLIFEIEVLDIKDTPPPDDARPASTATPAPAKK